MQPIYGFIPKLPIKNIIINRALYTSLMEKLSIEALDDSVFTQLTQIHYVDYVHLTNLSLSALILICILNRPNDSKLIVFEEYIKSKTIMKQILIFVFMVFIKNIETAT